MKYSLLCLIFLPILVYAAPRIRPINPMAKTFTEKPSARASTKKQTNTTTENEPQNSLEQFSFQISTSKKN